MRVAIPLEQCWHPVPGGTARTALDLSAHLAVRPDVDVIGVSARHRTSPAPTWAPTVSVKQILLPRRLLYETWHGLRWPPVESATGPVDICHAVGGAVPPTSAPLVVTVHDLAFAHHPDMFTRHGLRFFRRALELTRRHAAQVQVPSRATLEDCAAAGIERERLRLVPWGCSVRPPSAAEVADVRRRLGLPERWVVAVGTLEPRKNLRRLLAAWRDLRRDDVQLVLVGPGGWGDALPGSSLPANVTMTGFVDDRTRDCLYAGAAVSCYPSVFEGFGLPVLESMALGCPVVTSRGTATQELVEDGAGVLVDPTDVDAIAAGIAGVLDDDAERMRLIEAGRRRAEEYSWVRTAELSVRGYAELVS